MILKHSKLCKVLHQNCHFFNVIRWNFIPTNFILAKQLQHSVNFHRMCCYKSKEVKNRGQKLMIDSISLPVTRLSFNTILTLKMLFSVSQETLSVFSNGRTVSRSGFSTPFLPSYSGTRWIITSLFDMKFIS